MTKSARLRRGMGRLPSITLVLAAISAPWPVQAETTDVQVQGDASADKLAISGWGNAQCEGEGCIAIAVWGETSCEYSDCVAVGGAPEGVRQGAESFCSAAGSGGATLPHLEPAAHPACSAAELAAGTASNPPPTAPREPSAPRYVSAESGPSPGHVTLSWEAPSDSGGFPITAYHVYAGDSPASIEWVGAFLPTQSSYLDPCRGHGAARYYQVAARNALGEGDLSPLVSAESGVPPPYGVSIMGATLPSPRSGTSAVWTGERAYIFGSAGNAGDDIVQYDPEADCARTMQSSVSRSFSSAAWDGTRAIIFGGLKSGIPTAEILHYQPPLNGAPDSITTTAMSLPTARSATSAVQDGSTTYIFAGKGTVEEHDEVLSYPAGQVEDRFPQDLAYTAAIWDGAGALVFGGGSTPSPEIYRFAPGQGLRLVTGVNLPHGGMEGMGAAFNGRHAFIFGGVARDGTHVPHIQFFDPSLSSLTTLGTSLPTPRAYPSAVWAGNAAFVFGGKNGQLDLDQIVRFVPGGLDGPRNLVVERDEGDGRSKLRWEPPESSYGMTLTGFQVYRGLEPYRVIKIARLGNLPEFKDPNLPSGTACYRVTALFTPQLMMSASIRLPIESRPSLPVCVAPPPVPGGPGQPGQPGVPAGVTECLNGMDDDGDGRRDYPTDRGCDSYLDMSETSSAYICDDGIDNEQDGKVDYPDDDGCDSPEGQDERSLDDRDTDGDGLSDLAEIRLGERGFGYDPFDYDSDGNGNHDGGDLSHQIVSGELVLVLRVTRLCVYNDNDVDPGTVDLWTGPDLYLRPESGFSITGSDPAFEGRTIVIKKLRSNDHFHDYGCKDFDQFADGSEWKQAYVTLPSWLDVNQYAKLGSLGIPNVDLDLLFKDHDGGSSDWGLHWDDVGKDDDILDPVAETWSLLQLATKGGSIEPVQLKAGELALHMTITVRMQHSGDSFRVEIQLEAGINASACSVVAAALSLTRSPVRVGDIAGLQGEAETICV